MAGYRGTPREDRAKALAAVLAVHVALAAAILTGLNVDTVTRAVERLQTFEITEPLPPPPIEEPPPPPSRPEESAPKDEAAPANVRSRPTPVVAPTPPIPLPTEQRINIAEVRGPEGLDRTAGAADAPGAGTGAGGQGSGFGGGGSGGAGSGSGDGRTPAILVRNIPRSDYRQIGAERIPQGSAGLALRVGADGRVTDCRAVRSSGDPAIDQRVCELAVRRLRFRPARDLQGRPIPYQINYMATWSRR